MDFDKKTVENILIFACALLLLLGIIGMFNSCTAQKEESTFKTTSDRQVTTETQEQQTIPQDIQEPSPTNKISSNSQSFYNKGISFFNSGHYEQAKMCFERALKQEPYNVNILYYYSQTQIKTNDIRGAKLTYQKIIQFDPNSKVGKYAKLGLNSINVSEAKQNKKAAQQAKQNENFEIIAPTVVSYKEPEHIPPAPNYIEGESSITTDNHANKNLKYYYYYPSSFEKDKEKSYPLIIGIPGLSENGKDFIRHEMKKFALKEGFAIVAPTFIFDGDEAFRFKESYQYPAAWSGKAMMQILAKLETEKGIKYSKLYLIGFSSGAEFVQRFSFLYPNKVAACAINGAKDLDAPEKKPEAVKYFVAIGNSDEPRRIKTARKFSTEAKALNIPLTYHEYYAGHEFSNQQIANELNFFKQVKELNP